MTDLTSLTMRVRAIFIEALQLDDGIDARTLRYNETDGWDSVGHMTLVAALETEFDCMFETDDILDMSNFDKAVDTVRART